MKSLKVLYGLCILLSCGAAYLGQDLPLSRQIDFLEPLRDVSSIVVGVVGVWMALIYPRALEDVLSRNSDAKGYSTNFIRLLRPLVISALVLAATLALDLLYLLNPSFISLLAAVHWIRGAFLGFLTFLALIQILALILAVVPAEVLILELRTLEKRTKRTNELISETRRGDDGQVPR